jgi:hypothetical protein
MRHARTAATVVLGLAASTLVASRASAVTANLPLSANGQAKSTDQTNFFINSPSNPVYVDWTPNDTPIKEQRAVLEFNLAGIPAGAVIQSADLLFNVSLYESSSNGTTTLYPSITFWSYAGNNAIDVADATQTTTALADYLVTDTGPADVPLNLARVQSLVNAHPAAIGILVYANTQDLTTGLWTAATGTSIAAPTLSLTYAVPEPSTLSLAALAAGAALSRRRRPNRAGAM